MDIIDLIASPISGAIGGNMVGGALNDQSLGSSGDSLLGSPRRGDCWRDSTIARRSYRLWQRCSRCRVPDRQHRDLRPRRSFSDARHRVHRGRDGARLICVRMTPLSHCLCHARLYKAPDKHPSARSLEFAIDEIKGEAMRDLNDDVSRSPRDISKHSFAARVDYFSERRIGGPLLSKKV